MKWKDKLKEWLKETPLKYPKNIKLPFFWETKCLNNLLQNHNSFIEYINKSKNKYATSFYNPNKTSLLIIPMPRDDKKFTTLKDFIDNASINHQKKFWKYVAKTIIKFMKENKEVYGNASRSRTECKPKEAP